MGGIFIFKLEIIRNCHYSWQFWKIVNLKQCDCLQDLRIFNSIHLQHSHIHILMKFWNKKPIRHLEITLSNWNVLMKYAFGVSIAIFFNTHIVRLSKMYIFIEGSSIDGISLKEYFVSSHSKASSLVGVWQEWVELYVHIVYREKKENWCHRC